MQLTNDPRLGLPSASNNAFWNCPGMWNLKKSIPPEALQKMEAEMVDDFTMAGTRVDKARENLNTLELSEEETELYQNGLKFEQLLVMKWREDNGILEYQEGMRKERLWDSDPETLEPAVSGELDAQYHTVPEPEHVLICDWKAFGKNTSPSERNTQMRVLAVLKWKSQRGIERIRVALNRCMAKVGATDYCDYTVDDLHRADFWMHQHLWLSRQPDAPLRAGAWCRFCPCKAFCEQAACYSLLPSVVAARALPDAAEVEDAVAKMIPADLKKIHISGTLIRKILDEVKTRLRTFDDGQLANLGLKRGKGRETHDITKVKECFDFLMTSGLSAEQVFAAMKFSNTDLAKTFRADKGLTSDKAAGVYLKTTLRDFITVNTSEAPIVEEK